METPLRLNRRWLVRNTALNLTGQVLSSLVAVVTIPYVVHRLGVERFGVLSIAWILLGYFSLFDLGLGRATTKHVAEALGKGDRETVPGIIWTSLSLQVLLGITGALALAALTPLLAGRVLNISPTVLPEARQACYLMSLGVPVVILSANLRGALEASQRFDLVNLVKIPASSLSVLMPAVGLLLGFGLPGIICLLLLSMTGSAIGYLFLCFRLYPGMKKRFSPRRDMRHSLLRFGGWITVCNMLVPLLISADRFLLGVLVSVGAVGYYTAPYEMIARAQIIPGNIGVTLFPAFAAMAASDMKAVGRLYAASLKYTLAIMSPIAFFVVLFARNILQVWLGREFAAKGTVVLQVLAIGVLINAIGQMPAHLLDGLGRPDLRAKIFLSYVVLYLGLAWLLISKAGIVGAAFAWTTRAAVELLIFLGVCRVVMHVKLAAAVRKRLGWAAMGCFGLVGFALITSYVWVWQLRAIAAMAGTGLFVLITWHSVLDEADKDWFWTLLGRGGRERVMAVAGAPQSESADAVP